MSVSRIALTTLWLALLAACGQSGPLYLPGNPSDVQQVPAESPPPADASDEDDEDDGAP